MNIKVEDGKYNWIFDESTAKLTCNRHGESWRDETGDGAIYALLYTACDLEEKLKLANERLITYGLDPIC
jgi:hypothetical protein